MSFNPAKNSSTKKRKVIALEKILIVDNQEYAQFLRQQGLKEIRREFVLVLPVSQAMRVFIPNHDGIKLCTLYDAIQSQITTFEQIDELRTSLIREVFPSIPVFLSIFSSSFNPHSYFLAIDMQRKEPVGLSNFVDTPPSLYNELTGVRQDYRNRGLAKSLKLMGIKYAIEHEYSEIWTVNEVTNKAILSLNKSLGFEKISERVWFTWE